MLIYIGKEVTPRRRAAIITMKSFGCSSRNIAAQTNVPKSTVNNIYRHALQNAANKRLEDCVSSSATGTASGPGTVGWSGVCVCLTCTRALALRPSTKMPWRQENPPGGPILVGSSCSYTNHVSLQRFARTFPKPKNNKTPQQIIQPRNFFQNNVTNRPHGPISIGKSAGSKMLSSPPYEIPVVHADAFARGIVAPGTRGYAKIAITPPARRDW